MSQEYASAVGMSICWLTAGSQLWNCCGWTALSYLEAYEPVQGRYAYGKTMCSCIAASAVTGLNTEPGGYVPTSARSSDG